METEKVAIREFRENLAGYLESGRTLAITRHGETLGFFIPAQKRTRKADIAAMRAAARELDAMIAAWGASEDKLMRESLVLNANILIRAILDRPVRGILEACSGKIAFLVPEVSCAEAEEHSATLVSRRGGDPAKALALLRSLAALGTLVEKDLYAEFEAEARKRLGTRDPEDWPILATALALRCPIWTEDTGFFDCGVATWTSASIRVFLDQPPAP